MTTREQMAIDAAANAISNVALSVEGRDGPEGRAAGCLSVNLTYAMARAALSEAEACVPSEYVAVKNPITQSWSILKRRTGQIVVEAYETLPEEAETYTNDQVDHPRHYGGEDNPYETIKVIEAWLTPEEFRGFLKGTVMKYISRVGKKDGISVDLKKAFWYLDLWIKTGL